MQTIFLLYQTTEDEGYILRTFASSLLKALEAFKILETAIPDVNRYNDHFIAEYELDQMPLLRRYANVKQTIVDEPAPIRMYDATGKLLSEVLQEKPV